jgi:hypothetical protein
MDYQTFRTPPRHLRPAPFWGINDRLMPEEAARQFRAFLDAGYSGAFFHARMGLISEYLGTEWFAAFQAALEAAKADDGYLWLYDEDCWPSGSVAATSIAPPDCTRNCCGRGSAWPYSRTPPSSPRTASRAMGRCCGSSSRFR